MHTREEQALIAKLTALADDELILGHRDSEWTGHAPILEEDIALANIAQDEIGHAALWYEARQELDGADPDKLVYFREAPAWLNVQMLELPKGDWAFSMLRQYLFDSYELVLYRRLAGCSYRPVREIAAKILREERFHHQHTGLWVERLGLGTEESRQRLQQALNHLWPYTEQLFVPLPGDEMLVAGGIIPDSAEVQQEWAHRVAGHLTASELQVPSDATPNREARGHHTEHLTRLLDELQEVARLEPAGTEW